MWLRGTWKKSSWTLEKKELIKHIECSNELAGVSVNVCEATEAPEE